MARGHGGGIAHDREVDEEDAVAEVIEQVGGDLQAEARLAGAAGAGEGEQADVGPAQQGEAVGHLLGAADEGRQLDGQDVGPGGEGDQRREVAGQAVGNRPGRCVPGGRGP